MHPTVAAPTIKLNNRLIPEDIQAINKLMTMVSLVAELRRSVYVCFAAGINESTLNDVHNTDTSFDQKGVVEVELVVVELVVELVVVELVELVVVELVELGGSILYMVLYTMCGYQSTYMTNNVLVESTKCQKYTYIVWGYYSIGLSR